MRVECESSKLTPRPLFKGRMAGHRWEKPDTTASDRWKKLGPLVVGRGPADPRVRPNPRWPTLQIARAHCFSNSHMHFELWCRPNFASKDVQNYFSKYFDAQKYFWIFVKNRKGARKVSSMQGCFEISNMQWEKSKKSREVKWWKSKYEIRTDLPSVRARRFESDERDLSPAMFYQCSARPGELDEDELATLCHTFFARLRVVVGSSG